MQNDDNKTVPPPAIDDETQPTRHEVALAFLNSAIKKDLIEHPPDGRYDPSARFYTLLLDLQEAEPEWPTHRAHLIFGLGTALYQQAADRILRKKAEENRPPLLGRKGFDRVRAVVVVEGHPVAIGNATADEKRKSTKHLAQLVDTYKRPRVSAEKLKEHEARLAQEKKFDRKVIPLTAGDKQMELWEPMEKLQAKLESAASQQRRDAAKKATKARMRRT